MEENLTNEEAVQNDIELLQKTTDLIAQQPDTNVQVVKIDNPSDKLEQAYLDYVTHNFEIQSKKDQEFDDYLKEEIKQARLSGELNSNQLMTIFLNYQTSMNDRYSRMVQPFAQMALEKERLRAQEASLQASFGGNKADFNELNKEVPKEVLQGLSTFTQIMSGLLDHPNQEKPVDEKES